jgi:hypothetical protein
VVRSAFLDLDKRSTWDPFVRKIEVTKGTVTKDLDPSSPEPEISVTLDVNMDGKESKFPLSLQVSRNDENSFVWGISIAPCGLVLFKADHAHAFLPADDEGKTTRFVQYERIECVGGKLIVNEENLLKGYTTGNEGLKRVCEEAL